MTPDNILAVVVFVEVLLPWIMAQQTVPMTIPVPENQSTTLSDSVLSLNRMPSVNPSTIPAVTSTSISTNIKRNDWWPPSEQEVPQTSSYAPETQQLMPATYYIPAPPTSAMLSHYRSEPWSPYGYPEFGYPVASPNANNQLAPAIPKYMAIGLFIGLLTLFAIIQGSIMSAKKKDAFVDVLPSRKKRDLLALLDFENMTPEQQDIFNNDAKVRCIQRTICQENSQLLKDFGPGGAKLAKYLTHSVKKSLRNASGWDRLVEDAGAAGLRGEDCNVLYRDCVLPVISKSRNNK